MCDISEVSEAGSTPVLRLSVVIYRNLFTQNNMHLSVQWQPGGPNLEASCVKYTSDNRKYPT